MIKSIKRLTMIGALMAAMLMTAAPAGAQNYVFMSGGTNILSNNNGTAANVTTFSYATCVFARSGNQYSNNGTYIRLGNTNLLGTARDLTLSGNTLAYGNYYLRYNNGWQRSSNNPADVVYVLSEQSAASITTPTVTEGQTTFTDFGSYTYGHGNSSYSPILYKFTPNSGSGTAYYAIDGGAPATSSTSPSSTTGINYTWSLGDGSTDDGHVRINASTGEVTYYNSYASNTTTAIKVTATHTASGTSKSSTNYDITFNALPVGVPTAIAATAKTIEVNDNWEVDNYMLTPAAGTQPYNYISAESSNPAVATVTNTDGKATIRGISAGSVTITLKAYGTDNTTVACSTTFTLTVEIIETGVSGGVVTLYDYEDHTWTYYKGVDASVDGGNYNTNYLGKLYSPNPRNVKITYKANGGAVSISESETTFVYYKTLEQGATAGQYPYQVISNPFSKRPNGKGFGGWKIKEGAEYIYGYADEETLPLDAEIVFIDLPYPSDNCTSAEIELEATWVNYNNRTYANSNTITYSVTGGTYETNFLVLNRNVTGTITVSSPCTIMMVEPDGSADYRNNYTFTGNITPNNNGVTKIEFSKWNSTNTVNANFKHLWIGRGMTTTSQCATLITGLNTTDATAGTKFSIKVESGKYDYFDFYKGHSTYNGGTSNTNATISGTSANAIITIGNDYDRASTNNQNLEFKYGPMLGYESAFSSRDNRDNQHTLDLTVKSGRIGYTFFMEETNTANYLQGGAGYCMYLSSAGSQTNVGRRNVLIEGGDICTIGSGVDSYNNAPSNNDTPSSTTNYNRLAFNVRIKGGTIHGNVYGGAAKSPSGGNRVMVMTGGQVKGWFAAGCNGTDSHGGQNYGTSWVYIGGNAKVDSEGSTKVLGYANGGNVYAAGAGRQNAATCGEMTFGSNLVVADNSYIERGIYGGGNYGYALVNTNIYITGGTNDGLDGAVNSVTTKGGVYGGANQQNGPEINLYMTGGLMKGGVYGGCNTQGTVTGSIIMYVNGGQVGTSSSNGNIHGGGYGSATRVSGNVDITLGATNQTEPGVTVYGDVYGGSAMGYVNGTSANTTYHTNVTLNAGTINGSLYGGGLGDGSNAANVYSPVTVIVNGGSVTGAVYGCNNANGAPQRAVTVTVNGTDPAPSANSYSIGAVFGGGNQANYTYTTPTVTVNNCNNSIEYVYGGGNAATVPGTDVTINGGNKIGNVFGGCYGANVTTNGTKVNVKGGTIGKVFGGNNQSGAITGAIKVRVNKLSTCPLKIGELYGGGNVAASAVGSIDIGCTGALTAAHSSTPEQIGHTLEGIGDLYGGANEANITSGNVNITIDSGMVYRVFGGNNTSGTISGTITVNIDKQDDACGWYVGHVYGGGNKAPYTAPNATPNHPAVNIKNGEVSYNVFGGGLGTTAAVSGNPQVILSGTAEVGGNVYGGGNAAPVSGNTKVTLRD